jgi:hypothetical protein
MACQYWMAWGLPLRTSTCWCIPMVPFFGTSTYVASLAHADVVWLVHSDAA